ncbi:MAG: hypothetical protein HY006_02365 [Candidatus Sungbacteria bacterium]|nr:hypothetical protein [Candidatus Sungbacteria bacterium]
MEQGLESGTQELHTNKQKRPAMLVILLLVIGCLVLFAVAGKLFFDRNVQVAPTGKKPSGPYETLVKDNEEFIRAESFLKDDKLDLAEEHYKKALLSSRTTDEEGQILYKIAVTKTRRDPMGAITIFKEIAADPRFGNLQRAYAVQRMAELFRKNSSREVTKEIFTGDPYESFIKEGDERLAYRRLYEYASSFSPLALSAVRAADWYSSGILTLSRQKSLSAEERKLVDEYTKRVRASLEAADHDIERTKNLLNAGALVPDALARKAVVLANMYEAGDTSFSDPEAAFRSAMEVGLIWHNDFQARFTYAAFLARTKGQERKKDIVDLLDNFYDDKAAYSGMVLVFTKEKNNILGNKADIILLAGMDPAFKSFLLTLGWDKKDFGM